jgi:hypothetical protein
MTTDPATHFKAANTSLIRLAVEAMASAPYLTAAEKQMRSEAVSCGIMAFLPSEPVQTMLASQAVGQHLLALDTFREAFNRSLTENASVRMRTAAAMCTRSTLSLMREIRVVRLGHHAAVVADKVAREEHEARLAREAAPEPVEVAPEPIEDVPEPVETAPAIAAESVQAAAADETKVPGAGRDGADRSGSGTGSGRRSPGDGGTNGSGVASGGRAVGGTVCSRRFRRAPGRQIGRGRGAGGGRPASRRRSAGRGAGRRLNTAFVVLL